MFTLSGPLLPPITCPQTCHSPRLASDCGPRSAVMLHRPPSTLSPTVLFLTVGETGRSGSRFQLRDGNRFPLRPRLLRMCQDETDLSSQLRLQKACRTRALLVNSNRHHGPFSIADQLFGWRPDHGLTSVMSCGWMYWLISGWTRFRATLSDFSLLEPQTKDRSPQDWPFSSCQSVEDQR